MGLISIKLALALQRRVSRFFCARFCEVSIHRRTQSSAEQPVQQKQPEKAGIPWSYLPGFCPAV
jgi:hypothetical protein